MCNLIKISRSAMLLLFLLIQSVTFKLIFYDKYYQGLCGIRMMCKYGFYHLSNILIYYFSLDPFTYLFIVNIFSLSTRSKKKYLIIIMLLFFPKLFHFSFFSSLCRNVIYNLSIFDLTEQQRLVFNSLEDDIKMCLVKGKDEVISIMIILWRLFGFGKLIFCSGSKKSRWCILFGNFVLKSLGSFMKDVWTLEDIMFQTDFILGWVKPYKWLKRKVFLKRLLFVSYLGKIFL